MYRYIPRSIIRRPRLMKLLLPVLRSIGSFQNSLKLLRWHSLDLPLNGQLGRAATVDAVIRAIEPVELVETGTFKGSTARYLQRRYGLPVYTVERNRYFYLYARVRLLFTRQIHMSCGTSLDFLAKRFKGGTRAPAFYYLDAHWYGAAPLRDEVKMIRTYADEFVICVDDFRVDSDLGYGFDTYEEEPLSLEYLQLEPAAELDIYFPALPAGRENSGRRGSVYLAGGAATRERIKVCVPKYLQPVVRELRHGSNVLDSLNDLPAT